METKQVMASSAEPQEAKASSTENETQSTVTAPTQPQVSAAVCKKRTSSSQNRMTSSARKRFFCKKPEKNENLQWGYSLTLKLYDDPWKVKKSLTQTDLGNWSRLLIPVDMAEQLILPVLGVKKDDDALAKDGIPVKIWDVNTESEYKLTFKFWVSTRSYVFNELWREEFVKRRRLNVGDEIGLHWDPFNRRFNFSVLKTATATKGY